MRTFCRLLAVTSLIAGEALVGVLAAAPGAAAAPPSPVTVRQTAARHFGNGAAATDAFVHASAVTVAPDGSTYLFDSVAHQIRRVDTHTGTIALVAGGGSYTGFSSTCAVATGGPATATYLDQVNGLWVDTAGDVFMWMGYTPWCSSYSDVYRLDASDHQWHVALKQRTVDTCCTGQQGAYRAIAVDPAGELFAADAPQSVIRRFAPGADPTSGGTIVAGVPGSPGTSGDGGPATSAQINNPTLLATTADGSVLLAHDGGYSIREVDRQSGVISSVAGVGSATVGRSLTANDGTPATDAQVVVDELTVGSDGDVYFSDDDGSTMIAQRAFSIGGVMRTVVAPAATAPASPGTCTHAGLAVRSAGGGDQLLVACGGTLRGWAADGSASATAGALVAGVDDADGYPASRDGAQLANAFLPSITGMAPAADGSIAVATADAVRRLSGVSNTDTVSTLAAFGAGSVGYGSDGTLYAAALDPTSHVAVTIKAISADGVVRTVAGGGAGQPAEGADALSVQLPPIGFMAVDATQQTIYFDSSSSPHIWALDVSTEKLHVFAGSDSAVGRITEGAQATTIGLSSSVDRELSVDQSTHALYVHEFAAPGGLLRIDPDGSVHVLGCTAQCTYGSLAVGPDGTLYVGPSSAAAGQPIVALRPDGSAETVVSGVTGPITVLADGRLAGFPDSPATGTAPREDGALLAVSDPVSTVAATPAPAAMVQASSTPGQMTITVTPPAVAGLNVGLFATELPAAPLHPTGAVTLASFTTDGTTTPRTFTFVRLATDQTAGPPLLAGHVYRFIAFTTTPVGDPLPYFGLTPAPSVATVTAVVDDQPPAPPALTVSGNIYLLSQVTIPTDPDIFRVSVRWLAGTTAPASQDEGLGEDFYVGGFYTPGGVAYSTSSVDPMGTYTVAAFAEDLAGNVSVTTQTRYPAQLAPGNAAGVVGFQPVPDGADIVWSDGQFAAAVRYAPGDTPPASPIDGSPLPQFSGAWGNVVTAPVQPGQQVAVSIFKYPPDTSTTYLRTSFIIVGGTSSDTLSLAAPHIVAAGFAPVLTATLLRHDPADGLAHPLTAQAVQLYQRPAGSTAAWTFTASGRTGSDGSVALHPPAITAPTEYEARSLGIDNTSMVADASAVAVDSTVPVPSWTSLPAAVIATHTASFGFDAADPDDDPGTLRFTCAIDQGVATPCTSPMTAAGLPDGSHRLTLSVADPAGNVGAQKTFGFVVDTAAPRVNLAKVPPVALASALPVAWAGVDARGVASYDLRWRRINPAGLSTGWKYPAALQHTTATKWTLSDVWPGYEYCLSVRARDTTGNTSAWTAQGCSAVARDDRALTASSGWQRATGSRYYLSTFTATTRQGAVMTKTNAVFHQLSIVATKCPSCGSIGVYVHHQLLSIIKLRAATTARRQIITLSTKGIATGTIELRVLSSAKKVEIDGLALSSV